MSTGPYPVDGAEAGGLRERMRGAVYDSPANTRWFQQHVHEIEDVAPVDRGDLPALALPSRELDLLSMNIDMPDGAAMSLDEALRLTGTDGFLVLSAGAIACELYFGPMRPATAHMWQSVTKSLISCVAGNLVARDVLGFGAPIAAYVPELAASAYGDAQLRDLLDMTVGVEYSEDYENPDSDVGRLDRLYGARKARSKDEPGSSYRFATEMAKKGEHGREFEYVSLNTQVMGWVMERATGLSVPELIGREVWRMLGSEHEAYIALDGAGNAQSEGGFCCSLRDLGRFGLALLGQGGSHDQQALPEAWIADTLENADRDRFKRSEFAQVLPGGAYRNNFWVPASGRRVLQGRGIYGQMLHVDREADLVIAKFSTWSRPFDIEMAKLDSAIAASLTAPLSEQGRS